jgi:hypothetical protein
MIKFWTSNAPAGVRLGLPSLRLLASIQFQEQVIGRGNQVGISG